MGQALHMMNGDTVMSKVLNPDNVLSDFVARSLTDDQVVTTLYQSCYMRLPSDVEMQSVRNFLNSEQQAGRPRRRALEGVLWSLLNSKEFQLNH